MGLVDWNTQDTSRNSEMTGLGIEDLDDRQTTVTRKAHKQSYASMSALQVRPDLRKGPYARDEEGQGREPQGSLSSPSCRSIAGATGPESDN